MPSIQRRRGEKVRIHRAVGVKDRRGNWTRIAGGQSIEVTGFGYADRSSRAEVPGQVEVDVYSLILPADIPGFDLWSKIEWRGCWWDIVTPPSIHSGDRHTKHWTVLVRQRPDDGGVVPELGGAP